MKKANYTKDSPFKVDDVKPFTKDLKDKRVCIRYILFTLIFFTLVNIVLFGFLLFATAVDVKGKAGKLAGKAIDAGKKAAKDNGVKNTGKTAVQIALGIALVINLFYLYLMCRLDTAVKKFNHDGISCVMRTFSVLFVVFWGAALYGDFKKNGKIGTKTWITFAIDFVLFVAFFWYLHGFGAQCGRYHFYKVKLPDDSDLENLFEFD